MPSRFFRMKGGWNITLALEFKEDGSSHFIRKNGYYEAANRDLNLILERVRSGDLEEFTPVWILRQRAEGIEYAY